jgi:hypothetical protein
MAIEHSLNDPREEAFRQDNQRHSFRAALFGSLGGASFFGMLMKLSSLVVDAVQNSEKGAEASAFLSNPVGLLLMGGLAAAGVAFTYFAQREHTHLKIIGDEHLAYRQAKCLEKGMTPLQCHEQVHHREHEHHEHQRKDGKTWAQAVASGAVHQANEVQLG